ncbi:hypothetical protein BDV10DRAFT_144850 [Aspergillus recurvatus]
MVPAARHERQLSSSPKPQNGPYHDRASSSKDHIYPDLPSQLSTAHILARLSGDRPDRAQQMTASIGTQCTKRDLTRYKGGKDNLKKEGRSETVHDLGSGYDILARLPGDAPDRTQQMTASIDTQLRKINLMRREVWHRLNAGRGNLEQLDEDCFVRNLGSERIRVLGVVRNVEWRFKKGARTYKSDFYIIEMRYDVLLGTDTINKYRLLRVGSDLLEHLESMP